MTHLPGTAGRGANENVSTRLVFIAKLYIFMMIEPTFSPKTKVTRFSLRLDSRKVSLAHVFLRGLWERATSI